MALSEEETQDVLLSLQNGDNTTKNNACLQLEVRTILNTEYLSAGTLDLSRKNLHFITDDILRLSKIQNLYLEGNEICKIPDNFFSSLSSLIWLDLRNNKITCLPPEIGQHRGLKTLLLEGNPIKELPVQLGNLITLRALSLRHCPIEFPPQEIVHQGLQCILKFLRSTVSGKPVNVRSSLQELPPVEKLKLTDLVKSSSDFSEDWPNQEEMQKFEKLKQEIIRIEKADIGDGFSHQFPHQLATEADFDARIHVIPCIKRRNDVLQGTFPELPPYEMHSPKKPEERKLAALKEFNERQALLEQRKNFRKQGCILTNNTVHLLECQKRRDLYVVSTNKSSNQGDAEVLKEWRAKAKIMQEKKAMEHKQERKKQIKRDENFKKIASSCVEVEPRFRQSLSTVPFTSVSERPQCSQCVESVKQQPKIIGEPLPEVVKSAPYAMDSDVCQLADNLESVNKNIHRLQNLEKYRTGKSLKELDEERAARDRELEYRIRAHIQMMQERRRKPKGTTQEELNVTRKEMEATKQLQSELVQRKLERDVPLEYRFTAFTGEQSPRSLDNGFPQNVFSNVKF
ncbi:leucine-rich repeat-containing protein 27 isoform X1 [Lepisosteus oculatus]|uniref:leucine-rich repeat-containing protein 27 isoform X1 n=1 Tax=Lepisosteus oculatus TaxID=7918 RepID=UPI00371F8C26